MKMSEHSWFKKVEHSTLTMRLEKSRLEEVEMWMAAPYAFSPWFSSRAYTTILLHPVSTTNPADAPIWLQSDQAACSLELQNCLEVKHGSRYLSLTVTYVPAVDPNAGCYSLNVHEVDETVENEVGNAGVFLLAAIPEGKLRQETRVRTFLVDAETEKLIWRHIHSEHKIE